MRRLGRKFAWLVLTIGLLPAWVLQCDKAALNFQRGFWYGLGWNASDSVADTFRGIRLGGE